jgi:tetratricopeptide (TPR) repeat protein
MTAGARGNLGNVYVGLGRPAEALTAFAEEETLARRIGYRLRETLAHLDRGALLVTLGAPDEADAPLRAALDASRSLGFVRQEGDAQRALGEAAFARGDLDAAAVAYRDAVRIQGTLGRDGYQAECLLALGALFEDGDPVAARELFEEAFGVAAECGHGPVLVRASAHLALTPRADRESLRVARQLFLRFGAQLPHRTRLEAHWLHHRTTGRDGPLRQAARLLAHWCDHAPVAYRARCVEHVPLHRAVDRAVRAGGGGPVDPEASTTFDAEP